MIPNHLAAQYPPERLMFPFASATGRVMDSEARLQEVGQRSVRTPKVMQQITPCAPETVRVSGKTVMIRVKVILR